jgi:hypothetical protein
MPDYLPVMTKVCSPLETGTYFTLASRLQSVGTKVESTVIG